MLVLEIERLSGDMEAEALTVTGTFPIVVPFQSEMLIAFSHPRPYRLRPTWPISPSQRASRYARTTFASDVVLRMKRPMKAIRRYRLPSCIVTITAPSVVGTV